MTASAERPFEALDVLLEGTNLIEASAGTGKTYTITTLYLRLLLEKALEPASILVVTYTNAATAELRARIRRRLREALAILERRAEAGDETLRRFCARRISMGTLDADCRRLRIALREFDDAAIFTIHGFCQRMLQENAFESAAPFDVELMTDETPLRMEIVYDFWARTLYDAEEITVRDLAGRITPERLMHLAARAASHVHVPVLPEELACDLDPPLGSWREAHGRAAAVWRAQREVILDELAAPGRLNGNSYRQQRIRSLWGPEIEAGFSSERPGRFSLLERLTTSKLRTATRRGQPVPSHPFFALCQELFDAEQALIEALDLRRIQLQVELVRYARRELLRRKEAARVQSFDDLLYRLQAALERSGGRALAERIRRRFPAVLIDEFQDTDPVQYEIFRRINEVSRGLTFLIGDPKQAIYAFRGADVFAYLAAKHDAGDRTHPLHLNWRSDALLVDAVNTLFTQADPAFVLAGIEFRRVSAASAGSALGGSLGGRPPLEILFVRRNAENESRGRIRKDWQRQLTRAIAADIGRLLSSGATIDGRPVEAGDVAVLCRLNLQAAEMQEELRALRIPSVVHGDASVFDSAEALQLERLLRAVAEPGDRRAIRAALCTPLLGLDAERLLALQTDEREWNDWVERFHGWHDVWRRLGFMPAFRRLIEEQDVQSRLLSLVDGERRLTNLFHLGELVQMAVTERRQGPLAVVEWLQAMRADPSARAEMAAEAAQIRLESDARAVQLVTIHRSKGLEYPIAYCPYLWDSALLRGDDEKWIRFHDPNDGYRLKLDLGSGERESHLNQAQRESLAESLRLLYVALTRARHRCVVAWGAFRSAQSSALGYLLHGANRPLPANFWTALDWFGERADEEIAADLVRLAERSNGAIGVSELPLGRGARLDPREEDHSQLEACTPERALRLDWRLSSFSAMVAAHEGLERSGDAADRDEAAVAEEAEPMPHTSAAAIRLAEFPSSARSGQLLHSVFERLEFTRGAPAILEEQLRTALSAYGFDQRFAPELAAAIAGVLETPLDESGLTLSSIPRTRRMDEMEFLFPVCEPATQNAARAGRLTSAGWAEILARHGAPASLPAYAERVRRMGFAPFAGFLRGFIDLVFEHAGRWYVVDYKSNLLGARPQDYAPERLGESMAQHDYFLQYQIYTVALHRYLSARLPRYDYDSHFGGVYYLFLRGMSPSHPRGFGIFFDRPPRALIQDLSDLLRGA